MNISPILLPLAILACSVSSEANSVELQELKTVQQTNKLFTQFVAEIPAYSLPIKMGCGYDRPSRNLDFRQYETFFPDAGHVVAKLNTPFNYALIIFDFPCDYSCPKLYSYNSNGVRIDSIGLTPGQCGEDPFMSSSEWFLIDENLHIELVDTTQHYSFTGSKRMLDSTTVETNNYQLSGQGTFDFVRTKTVLQGAE